MLTITTERGMFGQTVYIARYGASGGFASECPLTAAHHALCYVLGQHERWGWPL